MKAKVLFTFMILLSFGAHSQVLIRGTVKNNKGKAIIGAAITLKDTYDGTITDSVGGFSFKTYEKGDFWLSASAVTYKTIQQKIFLDKDTITASFSLKEEITELDAVVISAGSFEASDKRRSTVLKPLDIATTAGANADIAAALQTLPGAQRVGESEGLFIRGGSAEESKIIIDGAVVNNFFFSSVPGIAQRGRFSPFLFNNTTFSTGGYSALYGQALSAVLTLESVDLPMRSEVQAGISPFFANAGFQKVSKNKRFSWGSSYVYSNLTLYMKLVPQGPDFFKAPTSHNIDANFRFKTKKNNILKGYAYLNTSTMALSRNSLDSVGLKNVFSLNNANFFTNFSWKQFLKNDWKWYSVASFSYNKDIIASELHDNSNTRIPLTGIQLFDMASFDLNSYQMMLQGRSLLEKRLNGLNAIRFGGEVWRNEDNYKYTFYTGTYNPVIRETYGAGFIESDIYISRKLAFRPGVRFEYTDLISKANIAPRASISYQLAKPSQVSFDYGIFYQTPDRIYLAQNQNFNYTRADHYILTFQHMTRDYTFRTQVFHKDYKELLKTDINKQYAISTDGYGYARGIELFWRDKKTVKGVDYWISYSYLDTKRDYLNYPIYARPTFAADHSGSVVVKKFWTKRMFGINWSYNWATGRPYFNPNRPESEYLSDRTQFYNTHNFSFNWLTKIAKSNAIVVLGVNNVFNQKQIFGYNYSARIKDPDGLFHRENLGPPASMSFFAGLFMSWGVDRTQQNINNNL